MECFDFLTVNETPIHGSLHKTEFKSPAEERLIRKMAKMALNGYEIGIQRKIKPADHIQSMADRIQDTVVTKHPLNTDSLSSEDNSRESTLRRPLHKNFERGYNTSDSIQSIGDKIKDTIISKHPASINFSNNGIPVPPPIPNSPIPTFNAHSTPIVLSQFNNNKKPSDFIPKNLSNTFTSDIHAQSTSEKSYSGSGYSSSDDSNKDKYENNYINNTLRKTTGLEKSFLNGMNNTTNQDTFKSELKFDNNVSNTLSNKRSIFEKKDITNGHNNTLDNVNKSVEKRNNGFSETNTLKKKASIFEKSRNFENGKSNNVVQDDLNTKKQELPNNLYDNSLYTLKSVKTNGTNGTSNFKGDIDNMKHDKENKDEKENSNGRESQEDTETEVVVKRRQKKIERNDDGRRDSHIIARPLSTMTSVDVTDGQYPVCHKCDKAIKR